MENSLTMYERRMLQLITDLVLQTKENNLLLKSIIKTSNCNVNCAFQKKQQHNEDLQEKSELKYAYNKKKMVKNQSKVYTELMGIKKNNLLQSNQRYSRVKINTSIASSQIKEQQRKSTQKFILIDNEDQVVKKAISKQFQSFQIQVLKSLESISEILWEIKQKNINSTSQEHLLNRQIEEMNSNGKISQKLILKQTNKEIIDNQKHYYRLSSIQPHADRRQTKVRIHFLEMIKNQNIEKVSNINQIKGLISQWLGMVYRTTASISWNMLQTKTLNYEETKILFTENIIFNFIQLMKDVRLIKQQSKTTDKDLQLAITDKINSQSVAVLKYLCKQYPQTKIQAPNMALRQITPQIDEKGRIQYDLIGRSKVKFIYKQSKDYAPQIMEFINYLIDVTENQYDRFQKYIWRVFQNIFIPPDQRKLDNSRLIQQTGYKQKIKKFTKYSIGRKIPKNTEKYKQKEIQNGIFFIKSPQIMRIIAKWVEDLTKIIQDPKGMIRDWFYPFKKHDGSQLNLEYAIRNGVYNVILDERIFIFERLKEIQKLCFEIQYLLTQQQHITGQKLVHLSEQQINVGLFASNIKNALSEYLFMQLIELIHFLLNVPRQVDVTKLNLNGFYFQKKAKDQLDSLNLISFRIFDLLRCKCISGEDEIIYLMNTFKQKDQKAKKDNFQQPDFTLVRVKDRLGDGSRDILINAQILNGLVFQIQLSIASHVQEKQQLLDKYNHFLYELRRSTFLGPLIQNVSIWTSLEQRASFFDDLTKKKFKQTKNIPFSHQCFDSPMKRFSYPIVCVSCKSFYDISRTCLLNWKCQHCNLKLCGECKYLGFSQFNKKKHLFGQLLPYQFLQTLKQVNLMKEENAFKYYFFIPKNSLKTQLCFLKSYMAIPNFPHSEIAQVVINPNINKILTKGFCRDLETGRKGANLLNQDYFIYEINPNYVENVTIERLKQIYQEDNQIRIISLLYQPNFISTIKYIVNKKKFMNLLKNLTEIMNEKQLEKVTIIKFDNLIVIGQVYIGPQEVRAKLTRRQNFEAIRKCSRLHSSILCLEHKNLSNQFDEDKIEKRIQKEIMNNLFSNVTKLFLNYGNIVSIQYLKAFKNVQVFSISHNKIISLKGVEGMVTLKSIHFDNNQVTSLQPLEKLTNLRTIIGNNNKIQSLKGVQQLSNLIEVSLFNNSIKEIADNLNNLKSLEVLYLRQNLIQQIKNKAILNIKNISLSGNPLKKIQTLQFMPKLTNFSASGLKMERIPFQPLRGCQLLTDLSLHQNMISKIEGLSSFKALKYLGLNNNYISKIQGLEGLKLQKIHLNNNRIKVIQGISTFIDHLKELCLLKNCIEDIGDLRDKTIDFKIQWSRKQFSEKAILQMEEVLGLIPMNMSKKMLQKTLTKQLLTFF